MKKTYNTHIAPQVAYRSCSGAVLAYAAYRLYARSVCNTEASLQLPFNGLHPRNPWITTQKVELAWLVDP